MVFAWCEVFVNVSTVHFSIFTESQLTQSYLLEGMTINDDDNNLMSCCLELKAQSGISNWHKDNDRYLQDLDLPTFC